MTPPTATDIRRLLQFHFQAHPWHGVTCWSKENESALKEKLNVFVELTPTDGIKYELDKNVGHIKVDRPQKYSNLCPTLYGFIPRTYCGKDVGAFCCEQTGRNDILGDGDPLDICVLTEKPISHIGILVTAIPIGGLRMIDHGQADDKIIAVLSNDLTYGSWRSIKDMPTALVDRLRQYFLTYKQSPDAAEHSVEVPHVFDREEALEIIARSERDYKAEFGSLQTDLVEFLHNLAETVSSRMEVQPPALLL
jgi:inorganic pyrophosphatase